MKIVAEEAVPLEEALEEYRNNDFFIRYGLLQLLVKFHCIINHNYYESRNHYRMYLSTNACRRELTFSTTSVVFSTVTSVSSLEWKLAGLEYSHAFTDSAPTKSAQSAKYDPPEVVKGGPHMAQKW